MGCMQSSEAEEPRARAHDNDSKIENYKPGAVPIQIGNRGRDIDPNESMLSQSYTDRRMLEEEDFLDSIVKKTEKHLINTTDYGDPMEKTEFDERAWKYGNLLLNTPHNKASASHLPKQSSLMVDVRGTLATPIDTSLMEELQAHAMKIDAALSKMCVHHDKDVVVQLADVILK
eukprot:m.131275 g.131275  ORF g.131275 m.131275 type:complete len:174 (+) comp14621_c0_seq1:346-867(+)